MKTKKKKSDRHNAESRETCPCATCNLTRFYNSQAAR